jgi:hypothetical protein
MTKTAPGTPDVYIGNYLKFILGALLGMFISGAAMTAIGQPTTTHTLSGSGNVLWHVLLGLHLAFLAVMTITATGLFIVAVRKVQRIKARAVLGLVAILFGIVCGSFVLHKIHPGIFLFCMALSFVFIGATYGPLGAGRNQDAKHKKQELN